MTSVAGPGPSLSKDPNFACRVQVLSWLLDNRAKRSRIPVWGSAPTNAIDPWSMPRPWRRHSTVYLRAVMRFTEPRRSSLPSPMANGPHGKFAVAKACKRFYHFEQTTQPQVLVRSHGSRKSEIHSHLQQRSRRNASSATAPTTPLDQEAAQFHAQHCLGCDRFCALCVTVCPNRANLLYQIQPGTITVPNLIHHRKRLGRKGKSPLCLSTRATDHQPGRLVQPLWQLSDILPGAGCSQSRQTPFVPQSVQLRCSTTSLSSRSHGTGLLYADENRDRTTQAEFLRSTLHLPKRKLHS